MTPPITVLQISDLHILPGPGEKMLGVDTEFYFECILELAHQNRNRYDLILLTGDLAQNPCLESYQRIFKKIKHYDTETICLPGNHDDFNLMTQVFNSGSVNCKNHKLFPYWQIVCLNSQIVGQPGGHLAERQLDQLEAYLKRHADMWTLIAVHHNCLATHSQWLDTMTIDNSAALFARISKYPKVKAITTGHIHQVMHREHQSILNLGTPSTCFQFTPNSENFSLDKTMPGYRVFQLFPEGTLKTEIYRLPGELNELTSSSSGY